MIDTEKEELKREAGLELATRVTHLEKRGMQSESSSVEHVLVHMPNGF